MKVYVVISSEPYETDLIHALRTDKVRAEADAETLAAADEHASSMYSRDYHIEEMELDGEITNLPFSSTYKPQ